MTDVPFLISIVALNEGLHSGLILIVNFFIVVLEFIGLLVIVYTSFKCFYRYCKKDPKTKLDLAEGLAMGLEFKLGSEILRTVVVRDLSEIAVVGAIIALRAALALLIHWEIKTEIALEKKAREKNE
ncbi:MAG TPA: DUF1622 domain-containing protein [Candidatus Merdenecus merdavium]|nr:DUF1622 domain-containing protein [Candidatus Merdenecus merdavium]